MEEEMEFEVSPSLLEDLKAGTKGNEQAMKEVLSKEHPLKFGALKEASEMFPHILRKDADEILSKHDWNIDSAMLELFERNKQREQQKRERNLERVRQEELEFLNEKYNGLDPKIIQKVFHENNCDPKKTGEVLMKMIEEETKLSKEAVKRSQEKIVMRFLAIFKNLSKSEVAKVLEENNYNEEKSTEVLSYHSNHRYLNNLVSKFSSHIDSEQIKKMFFERNFSFPETFEACRVIVQKKKEEQKPKKEEQPKEDLNIDLDEEDRKKVREHSMIDYTSMQNDKTRDTIQDIRTLTDKIIQTIEPSSEPPKAEPKKDDENKDDENKDEPEKEEKKEEEKKEEEKKENDEPEEDKVEVEIDGKTLNAKVTMKNQTKYTYVALFDEKETDPNKYLAFKWLCYFESKGNVVPFDLPKLNGSYQLRVFTSSSRMSLFSSYEFVCKSEPFQVDVQDKLEFSVQDEKNTVTVQWTIGSIDPVAEKCYVTVHFTNEERYNYYRRYNWVSSFDGQHVFKKLVHSGEYEARLYSGTKLLLKSNSLEIKGI